MSKCPTCGYIPEQSYGEYLLEQQMLAEAYGDIYEDYGYRKPIWIDSDGKEYLYWKEIENSHLVNIVRMMKRLNIEVPDKFKRQISKRKLTELVV